MIITESGDTRDKVDPISSTERNPQEESQRQIIEISLTPEQVSELDGFEDRLDNDTKAYKGALAFTPLSSAFVRGVALEAERQMYAGLDSLNETLSGLKYNVTVALVREELNNLAQSQLGASVERRSNVSGVKMIGGVRVALFENILDTIIPFGNVDREGAISAQVRDFYNGAIVVLKPPQKQPKPITQT